MDGWNRPLIAVGMWAIFLAGTGCQLTSPGAPNAESTEPSPASLDLSSDPTPYKRPVIVGGATGTSDEARAIERRLGVE